MMQIHTNLPALRAIRTPLASVLPHRNIGAPIEMGDAHYGNEWVHRASPARLIPLPIEAAIRQGDVLAGTTYRTMLILPELGRVDLTVMREPRHIAVRLRCDCAASYAWLVSRRHVLEYRLTAVLCHPSEVEVTHAG